MTESLRNLYKVNSRHIFILWRNFAASMLTVIFMLLLTKLVPSIFAPLVSTFACAGLYIMVYHTSLSDTDTCIIVPFTIFNVIMAYTFLTIGLNVLNVWFLWDIPDALIFFDGYFIPGLLLAPSGLLICTIIYIRRHKLSICRDCRLQNGAPIERGRSGVIFSSESELQIKNLMLVFALIATIQWSYYFVAFNDAGISARDSFIFTWITCSVILCDMLYFAIRYYNLYLDLKESDELVSPAELKNISARTYLRFYVICDDYILLTKRKSDELRDLTTDIIDTPFMTRQLTKSIPEGAVKDVIKRLSGVTTGVLKFFYGRRVNTVGEHRMLRYFYLLPGTPEDYPELSKKGNWISSERFKTTYNTSPMTLSSYLLGDMSRLATILVTRKIYNERGERRNKLMQYRPSFNFDELSNSDIDFHDDFWINISNFNSDHRFFKIKRWFKYRQFHKMPS